MDKPQEISINAQRCNIFRNYLPPVTQIHFLLLSKYNFIDETEIPLNIREGRADLKFIDEKLKKVYISKNSLSQNGLKNYVNKPASNAKNETSTIIKCSNIWFGYVKDHIVLKGIFLDIQKGEFISILGGNGTGKTTLIRILSGLTKPKKGKVKYEKEISFGYVNQNPMVHFREETVGGELSESSSNLPEFELTIKNGKGTKINFLKSLIKSPSNSRSFKSKNKPSRPDHEKQKLIDLFELSKLLDKHPYDCSGGEQQKIAIVKALLTNPDILFLDEPTNGIDPISKIQLGNKLKKLQENGLTIVMTTHDIDFAAEYSERCVLLFDGNIQVDDNPINVFSKNSFYTTFVNRMVKDYLPYCVTLKDVKTEWKV